MIASDWDVRHSRLPAQTAQRADSRRSWRGVNTRVPLGDVRPGLEASGLEMCCFEPRTQDKKALVK